jgi:hypothetical protein
MKNTLLTAVTASALSNGCFPASRNSDKKGQAQGYIRWRKSCHKPTFNAKTAQCGGGSSTRTSIRWRGPSIFSGFMARRFCTGSNQKDMVRWLRTKLKNANHLHNTYRARWHSWLHPFQNRFSKRKVGNVESPSCGALRPDDVLYCPV